MVFCFIYDFRRVSFQFGAILWLICLLWNLGDLSFIYLVGLRPDVSRSSEDFGGIGKDSVQLWAFDPFSNSNKYQMIWIIRPLLKCWIQPLMCCILINYYVSSHHHTFLAKLDKFYIFSKVKSPKKSWNIFFRFEKVWEKTKNEPLKGGAFFHQIWISFDLHGNLYRQHKTFRDSFCKHCSVGDGSENIQLCS